MASWFRQRGLPIKGTEYLFVRRLAGDVVAAFDYLKTRNDLDRAHVESGHQPAGWIMPLAAGVRRLSFLISIS